MQIQNIMKEEDVTTEKSTKNKLTYTKTQQELSKEISSTELKSLHDYSVNVMISKT